MRTIQTLSIRATAWPEYFRSKGHYPQAEQLQRRTLDLERRVLGPEHAFTLRSLNNLEDILSREGRFPEAETLARETQSVDQRVFGPDNPATAVATFSIACLAALQGHRDQEFPLLRESLDHGLPPRFAAAIEKNEELESLRADPRFIALVAYAKQRAAAAQKPN